MYASEQDRNKQLFSVYVIKYKNKKRITMKLEHIDSVRIERSLENLAYSFTCDCQPGTVQVSAGMIIQVFWDEDEKKQTDPIFCGYIDDIRISGQGGNSARFLLSITARSYAADILDSSESLEKQTKNLEQICIDVCKLYGVVAKKHSALRLKEASFICDGGSPFRVLNELVRSQGGILASNGWGAIEMAVPRTQILKYVIRTEDIISFDYSEDLINCYRNYKAYINEDTIIEEKDWRVRSSRRMELSSSDEDESLARQKIKNEKNHRYGLSHKLKLTLPDWQIPEYGTHWYENTNIRVDIPELGLKQTFFVYSVILSLSKFSGYTVELGCCNRSAYTQEKVSITNTKAKSPATREIRSGFALGGQVPEAAK